MNKIREGVQPIGSTLDEIVDRYTLPIERKSPFMASFVRTAIKTAPIAFGIQQLSPKGRVAIHCILLSGF